jgi:hypothetical protein
LSAKLSSLFGIRNAIRIVKAGEVALRSVLAWSAQDFDSGFYEF